MSFWSPLVGIAVGGLIAFLVSMFYYRKAAEDLRRAAEDLRWEGRVSHASQDELDMLVACYQWDKQLHEDEAICIGADAKSFSSQIRYKDVLYALRSLKVATTSGRGRGGRGWPMGQAAPQEPVPMHYSAVGLTKEGMALAEYLLKKGRSSSRVQKVYRVDPDKGGLKELIWSSDPQERLGKVQFPPVDRGESVPSSKSVG